MQEKELFKNQDLVLKVDQNIDTAILDLNKYDPFLDALCVGRDYQKDSIRETIKFLLSEKYQNTRDLAEENWHNNETLENKYSDFKNLEKSLQIPDKLSCSIDLATGTGKSYVMYGIAQIMLCEGKIDQVLVLCPSLTIEDGLTEKFEELASDKTLKNLLPKKSKYKNPRIINARRTVEKGDICIENIHAVFEKTNSSIVDSFKGKGKRTLVLNDEAHHIYASKEKNLKKWKSFLINPDYNFKYLAGFSGTCYNGDEYFSDVIYRYSLKQAIEEKQIKDVEYIYENQDRNLPENVKFQEIYQIHNKNKNTYTRIKPLTIFITKDITECKNLLRKFQKFLIDNENLNSEQAEAKTLIVTSNQEHKTNRPLLKKVDDKTNKIEFIFSVAMLSEGWDVKNVFQIVPHEKKAFNSKLLISQVLGRGLRIPLEYANQQPKVKVFNHDKWYKEIKGLVDEVLEREKKINSYIIEKEKDYNFEIHNIDYQKLENIVNYKKEGSYKFEKDYIAFSPQPKSEETKITYVSVKDPQKQNVSKLEKKIKFKTVDETVNDIKNKLILWTTDDQKDYLKMYPENKIRNIILNSLNKIKEKKELISEENVQKTLQSFGVIRRPSSQFKTIRYNADAKNIKKVETRKIGSSSISISTLYKEGSVIYDDQALKLSNQSEIKAIKDLEEEYREGSQKLNTASLIKVSNSYNLKTPLNLITVSHRPERMFVNCLIEEENAKKIDSWIKSKDTGFYVIEYAWRKGEHPKNGKFNPDFFIKIGNDILIVETKADSDTKDENKGKVKYAKKHVDKLNKLQNTNKYYFWMIGPKDYSNFFKSIREKNYSSFISTLENELKL